MKQFHVEMERSAIEKFTISIDAEDEDDAQFRAELALRRGDIVPPEETEFYGDEESSWEAGYVEEI